MRVRGFLIFLILASMPVICAEPRWVKLTSANFEFYTPANPGKALSTLAYFERLHSFFGRAMKLPARSEGAKRVQLIGFRSLKESEPYRLSAHASAHYMRSGDLQQIVIGRIEGQFDPTAVHEYIHLVVDRVELKIPRWLNEGLAELYSTLRPIGDKVIIGDVPKGRLHTLRSTGWIDLKDLVNPSLVEGFMRDEYKGSSFYAQSWLLAHMLSLSPSYRQYFPDLVQALHNGLSADAAFQSAYKTSLDRVAVDLKGYLSGNVWAVSIDHKLEEAFINPREEVLEPTEVELLLAGLLDHTGKKEEAAARYRELERIDPDNVELQRALAYRSLRYGDQVSAREHFARAVNGGSKDVRVYLDYSSLLQGQSDSQEELLGLLRQAVSVDPKNTDARYQLGVRLASQRRYDEALFHLVAVRKIDPERAPSYFRALALAYFHHGDREQAEVAARRAVKLSESPADELNSNQILEFITAPRQALAPDEHLALAASLGAEEGPPRVRRAESKAVTVRPEQAMAPPVPAGYVEVKGALNALECVDARARLRLTVDGQELALVIYEAEKVVVQAGEDGSVALSCGPQGGQLVTVEYEPRIDEELGSSGAVRRIQFH